MQARTGSYAKLHDDKTYLVPEANEITGWEIMQLQMTMHPTLKLLQHSNKLDNVDVSLAIHACENAEFGAFVTMLRHLSLDEKKEVAAASAKGINECYYKTNKPWDTFPAARSKLARCHTER